MQFYSRLNVRLVNYSEARDRISVLENSIKEAKHNVEDGENKTSQLQHQIKEAGTRKMKLEDEIRFLNAECARLGNWYLVSNFLMRMFYSTFGNLVI